MKLSPLQLGTIAGSMFLSLISVDAMYSETCHTNCHKQCIIKTKFPPVKFVEPTCHAKCELAKKCACLSGVPVPTVPLTPVEIFQKYGTMACAAPYEAITKPVIVRCANWDNRREGQDLITTAVNALVEARLFRRDEFNGGQSRWCPLPDAGGMAPDRGRIYLDSSLKSADPIDIASTLAHEMIHIRQYRGSRSTDQFKCDYSRKFLACGSCQDERHSMEREAYKFEARAEIELRKVQGYAYHFTNKCQRPVRLAIHYRPLDGQWRTEGWWDFDGDESAFLATDNVRLRSTNSIWYVYAETLDGRTYWAGDDQFQIGERLLNMKKMQDGDGDNDWAVSCP